MDARDVSFAASRNVESRLAIGNRITFSRADAYDLELIPGVSDSLAQGLLRSRREILAASPRQGCSAFTLVHGVGNSKARDLCEYLIVQ